MTNPPSGAPSEAMERKEEPNEESLLKGVTRTIERESFSIYETNSIKSYVDIKGTWGAEKDMITVELKHKIKSFTDVPELFEAVVALVSMYVNECEARLINPGDPVVYTKYSNSHLGLTDAAFSNMLTKVDMSNNEGKAAYLIAEEAAIRKNAQPYRMGVIPGPQQMARKTLLRYDLPLFEIDAQLQRDGEVAVQRVLRNYIIRDIYYNLFSNLRRFPVQRPPSFDPNNAYFIKPFSVTPFNEIADRSVFCRRDICDIFMGYVMKYGTISVENPIDVRRRVVNLANIRTTDISGAQRIIGSITDGDATDFMRKMLVAHMCAKDFRLSWHPGTIMRSDQEAGIIVDAMSYLLVPAQCLDNATMINVCNAILRLLLLNIALYSPTVGNDPFVLNLSDRNMRNSTEILPIINRLLGVGRINAKQEHVAFLTSLRDLVMMFGSGGNVGSRVHPGVARPVSQNAYIVEGAQAPTVRLNAGDFVGVTLTDIDWDNVNTVPTAYLKFQQMSQALNVILRSNSSTVFTDNHTSRVLAACITEIANRRDEWELFTKIDRELMNVYISPISRLALPSSNSGSWELIHMDVYQCCSYMLSCRPSKFSMRAPVTLYDEGASVIDACVRLYQGLDIADALVDDISGRLGYVSDPDYRDLLTNAMIRRIGVAHMKNADTQVGKMVKEWVMQIPSSNEWIRLARQFVTNNYLRPPAYQTIIQYMRDYPSLFGISKNVILHPSMSRLTRANDGLGKPYSNGALPVNPVSWSSLYENDEREFEFEPRTIRELSHIVNDPGQPDPSVTKITITPTMVKLISLDSSNLNLMDRMIRRGYLIIVKVPCPIHEGTPMNMTDNEFYIKAALSRTGPPIGIMVQPFGTTPIYDKEYADTRWMFGLFKQELPFRFWPHQFGMGTLPAVTNSPLEYGVKTVELYKDIRIVEPIEFNVIPE
jgi:hypothetical protein